MLEQRFQVLKHTSAARVNAIDCLRHSDLAWSSSSKKVRSADSTGHALTQTLSFHQDDRPLHSGSFTPALSQQTFDPQPVNSPRQESPAAPSRKKTYREALLTPSLLSKPRTPSPVRSRSFPQPPSPGRFSFRGRCFRCFGRSHRASHCRDPIRCTRCFKTGHIARSCMNRLPMEVYRAMRARLAYLSAFVPLSNDFFARQNRRCNAILIDVIPPANLGHFPQETIANGLANRFGGFPSDFHVARYRERDFVAFLPEWVPCKQLLRRKSLSLGSLQFRCFP